MVKSTLCLGLFLVCLVGCATTYSHSTKNVNDFERDKRECAALARKTLAARGIPDT